MDTIKYLWEGSESMNMVPDEVENSFQDCGLVISLLIS